jgi:hypothetical protein
LAAYQDLIIDLARVLFLRSRQGRIRVPKGFEASFQLSIDSIGAGSAELALLRTRTDGPRTGDLFPDSFELARDLVNDCIDSVRKGGDLPRGFPPVLAARFNAFGEHLREDESIEIVSRGGRKSTVYDRSTRKRLVLKSEPGYQGDVELTGFVVAADAERRVFQLQLEGRRVQVPFAEEHRRIVLAALLHTGRVEVRIVGTGMFDAEDHLEHVVAVRDISTVDEGVDNPELDIDARLGELASLSTGWLDGSGGALNREGLQWLAEFLHAAEISGLKRPHLYPTPEGGVQAEWSLPNDAEVSAVFDLSTRKASLLGIYTHNGASKEDELDASEPGAESHLSSFVASFDAA